MLKTQNLSVAYGKQTIIPNLSVSIPKGKITALIGPNGCGKSTLLKTLVRINKPVTGEVLFEDKPLSSYGDKVLARSLSLLPQILVSPEGISVRKLVEYGRSPYVSHWGSLGQEDQAIVEQAMRDTGVLEFADKPIESLSGGQRQRAWIAMIIAQDTDVVMLDEPTRGIDIGAKREIYKLMEKLAGEGMAILFVSSEMEEVLGMADRAYVMHEGRISGELGKDDLSEESIMHLATGGEKSAA